MKGSNMITRHNNGRRKRHGGDIRAFAVIAAAISFTPAASYADNDPRTRPPLVRTAVSAPSSHSARSFTGTVTARIESGLGFRVAGKIVDRKVDVGETVRRGQPLLALDPQDLELALRAKENAVVSARAMEERSAADEERYNRLLGAGAISKQAYDQARQTHESAVAALEAAIADANFARNEATYAVLVADSDGIVTQTLAEPGQVVAAGQIAIRVARSGEREAAVNLPETVRLPLGSEASASVYGDPKTYRARLRQLSSAADPGTRTFEARFVLEDAGGLPLGATVKVEVDVDGERQKAADTSVIPVGAVFDDGRRTGVWLVRDDATVTFHPVTVSQVGEETARVVGVDPGTRIVALGANFLSEGMQVRLAEGDAK
ncbi:efflux RND transporter periplasmic adaptor subunit [Rhizobium deserti]|uniref:Efflux RND transporter periplasmic adaptor subunit n=1 Tax=Rhizobium deserti TaxID=2547961 RepID=A0A4R5UMV5_9HYPH|nr:efflux RND transporter periplasmic adaptor subunit [Rhizobium deserti]TDK39223.1 efflux RND transporter periplasmic adaptor subunit [Rhizobium deserti]